MTDKLTFPQLLIEQNKLFDAIIAAAEAGDDEAQQNLAELLEQYVQPEIAAKVDGLAYVIQTKLPAEIEQLREYRDQIVTALKTREAALDNLKAYLKGQCQLGHVPETLIGDRHQIKMSVMSQPTVTITSDPANWGNQFDHLYETRIEYRPLKKAIAEAYKNGEPLPDGVVVSHGMRLGVSVKK